MQQIAKLPEYYDNYIKASDKAHRTYFDKLEKENKFNWRLYTEITLLFIMLTILAGIMVLLQQIR